jgi:hypothetical protein
VAVVDLTRADHYARASRADRTWAQYRSAFRLFAKWCDARGLSPMPAAPETLRVFVAWLADEGRTIATVNAYVAAIASAHSIAKEPFDRGALKDDLKGIRKAKPRKPRQARPLVATDLRAILGDFGEEVIDVRDRLLLTLGFAGALGRSELVGLDWQRPGDGTGTVVRDERGIAVTLLSIKAGDGEPVDVIIPCEDMPAACAALGWRAVPAHQQGRRDRHEPARRSQRRPDHQGASQQALSMADAIAKISWRTTASGRVIVGAGAQAQGGICGTCFTLESGVTISCAHHTETLFKPNPGFDPCRLYVLEWGGRTTELKGGCLRLFPDYDACVIDGYQSSRRYKISSRDPCKITSRDLRGYEAGATPFRVRMATSGRDLEIYKPKIRSGAQIYIHRTPQLHVFNLESRDIVDKTGYLFDLSATTGLSGGPMLDATDGTVAGLCFAGLARRHPPQVKSWCS